MVKYYIEIVFFVLIAYGSFKSNSITNNKGFLFLMISFILLALKVAIRAYTYNPEIEVTPTIFGMYGNPYLIILLIFIEFVSYFLMLIALYFLSNPNLYRLKSSIDDDILD